MSLIFKDREKVCGKKGHLQGKLSRKENPFAFCEYSVTCHFYASDTIHLTEYNEVPFCGTTKLANRCQNIETGVLQSYNVIMTKKCVLESDYSWKF